MEEIEYEDRAAKEAADMLMQKEFPQVSFTQILFS
jgi:hypothetical protein